MSPVMETTSDKMDDVENELPELEDITNVLDQIDSDDENPAPEETQGKRETCVFCGQDYASKKTLRHHYRTKHNDDYIELKQQNKLNPVKPRCTRLKNGKFYERIYCVKCNYVSNTKTAMYTHQMKFHPGFRESMKDKKDRSNDKNLEDCVTYYYKCQVCKEKFMEHTNMEEHQKRKHSEYYKLKKVNKEARMESFKCKICDKQFTTKMALQHHMYTHTGNFPFKCEICDMGFSAEWKVKRHMKVHEKMKIKERSSEITT